jgi:hypothetical protein
MSYMPGDEEENMVGNNLCSTLRSLLHIAIKKEFPNQKLQKAVDVN